MVSGLRQIRGPYQELAPKCATGEREAEGMYGWRLWVTGEHMAIGEKHRQVLAREMYGWGNGNASQIKSCTRGRKMPLFTWPHSAAPHHRTAP